MTQLYNIWNKWDKLKTVMLGQCYPPSFFKDIKNDRIRDALIKISEETIEDLENFEQILKKFGCQVIRPEIDPSENIMNYINKEGALVSVPRSPLQPRDTQLVVGNELFYVLDDHPSIKKKLDEYNSINPNRLFFDTSSKIELFPKMSEKRFQLVAGADWLTYEDYLRDDYFSRIPVHILEEIRTFTQHIINAPSITVVGKDIYLDIYGLQDNSISNTPNLIDKKVSENFRLNYLSISGHNDGCFHTLKPGAILSIFEVQTYENTFPGWDVCYLENQSWDLVEDFLRLKKKVNGKWWVPGEENNDEFTHFVETWLQDWVGYVEETVFDVNVLVLDENHVCVNNLNPTVIDFLKKHKMEPVYIPWRHRYFWDGGLHCITLDLCREGTQEDYFPDRSTPIIDFGFPN